MLGRKDTQSNDVLLELISIVCLVANGAGKPFDHPDAKELSRAGERAMKALKEVEKWIHDEREA